MAFTNATINLPIADAVSDYGSDFDTDGEQQLDDILQELEAGAVDSSVLKSVEENEATVAVPAAHVFGTNLPDALSKEGLSDRLERRKFRESSVEIEYDEPSRRSWNYGAAFSFNRELSVDRAKTPGVPDTRSPLERFRTAPKKPLSVTDLISPAWCELQYWYSLTRYGRKKRTAAMKQGTVVHKELEEQVHTLVKVEVKTREDAWGLKIWNIIQSLRTLRITGMTRELELWGVIDGQVINGVVDEVSYACPDEELEEATEKGRRQLIDGSEGTPANWKTLTDFFKPTSSVTEEIGALLGDPVPDRKVYLTDVKTRGTKSVPTGPALRPTLMQLSIYRKLLLDLATNNVNAEVIFDRYRLKPLESFSQAFIDEIGSLEHNFRHDSGSDDESPSGSHTDSMSELLAHSNLLALWSLMIHEFSKSIAGADGIGKVMQAEFRYAKDGSIIGNKTFAYDEFQLQMYLRSEMSWWKGEREARGVEIEEAFKCRSCEFAEECTWRKQKIEEATEKHRLRKQALAKSAV